MTTNNNNSGGMDSSTRDATHRKRKTSKPEAAHNKPPATNGTGPVQSYYNHNKQAVGMRTPLPVGGATKYGSCEVRAGGERPVDCGELRLCVSEKVADSSTGGGGGDQGPTQPAPKDWLKRTAERVPCLGIMLSLGASIFLGSAGMLVKMTQSVHGVQVAVFRAFIQLFVYGLIIQLRGLPWIPNRGERLPVLGRATLGAASITCSYFALKLIPLGDATVIRFSLPIWTLIVSYLVLNESCSLLKVAAVVISISGVVLIAKPEMCVYITHMVLRSLQMESEEQFLAHQADYESAQIQQMPSGPYVQEPYRQFEGSLLALCSSICLAMSLIALRLCNKTPAEITILWLSIFSIVFGTTLLVSLSEWRLPTNWPDLIYILLNGLCGAIGQWFITSALKVEQSGVISLARTFDIEVAFLYSAFLLKEQIRVTSIIGSLLVSFGVIAVVVPKWLSSRKSGQPAANKQLPPEAADSKSVSVSVLDGHATSMPPTTTTNPTRRASKTSAN